MDEQARKAAARAKQLLVEQGAALSPQTSVKVLIWKTAKA